MMAKLLLPPAVRQIIRTKHARAVLQREQIGEEDQLAVMEETARLGAEDQRSREAWSHAENVAKQAESDHAAKQAADAAESKWEHDRFVSDYDRRLAYNWLARSKAEERNELEVRRRHRQEERRLMQRQREYVGLGNDGRRRVVDLPPSPPRKVLHPHGGRIKSRESWNGVRSNAAAHAHGVVVFAPLQPTTAFGQNTATHNRSGKCLACSSRRCHVLHPPHEFDIGARRTRKSLQRRSAPNIQRTEHPVRLRNFSSAERAHEANVMSAFDDAMFLADRTLLRAERRDMDKK